MRRNDTRLYINPMSDSELEKAYCFGLVGHNSYASEMHRRNLNANTTISEKHRRNLNADTTMFELFGKETHD